MKCSFNLRTLLLKKVIHYLFQNKIILGMRIMHNIICLQNNN